MSINIYQPYTYLIGWSKLNKWYYGSRTAKNCSPQDLWNIYFTSSDIVKDFQKIYGKPDVIQVRRVFKTKKQTLKCENKVLKKVNISNKWLNIVNGFPELFSCENMVWINKGSKEKYASYEDLPNYLIIGWNKGRSNIQCKKMKYPKSKEHKRNIGLSSKGRVVSVETRLLKSLNSRGEKNPNYGKISSQKTRQKMKGQWTPERRAAQAKRTLELNKKNIGSTRSKETKEKMKIAWILRKENCINI